MKRYPITSRTVEAMAKYDSDARKLLQNGVTTGRVFYLKGITFANAVATAGTLRIYDYNTEGASPTVTTQVMAIYFAASTNVTINFEGPGIKFNTGVLGALVDTPGADLLAYQVTIWGFEEEGS